MKINLESKNVAALFPTDILFQTTFWSRVKSRLGWKALAFDIACPVQNGDVLVLTKQFCCNASTVYIPQGPEISPDPENYGPFLEEFSENLIEHLDPSVAFIRYDLPWKSPYQNVDDGHSRKGHPEARLRELRMNFGTKSWNIRKASVDMTVADSLVVNIGGPVEEILRKMKPKTRYNIRLAGRKEVVVESAAAGMLPAFYSLYCQTAKRNGFVICDFRYFSALFSDYLSWTGISKILLLLARRGRALLAGGIFAISGKTAHYLSGTSSRDNISLMGPYALHWEAIRYARKIGCNRYDMGAVSPTKDPAHPFYGLLRFKTRFGGEVSHRNGSWDFPINYEAYRAFCNSEMLSREKMI